MSPALPPPTRRTFLAMTGVSAAAFALGTGQAAAGETAGGRVPSDPFALGVASGDPLPDGVVLWTRLAPDPLAPDGHGGMPARPYSVRYEVAEDASFRRVVRRGQAVATPEPAHSVHAEVHGLRPGREYFYRFRAGSELSPVGRTRTAPDHRTTPSGLRFATASCAAWYHGHFTAYEHMAAEDLDLVLFLGDYIYEYGITAGNLWREGVPLPAAEHAVETETLEQYRLRYSLFKSDPNLQAAHANAPWLITTDDHEVRNNYAGDWSEKGVPPDDFLRRRAVAYRALYENQPLVYGARSSRFETGPDTLVGKSVYGSFVHDRMGGARQDWHYRVVTVDASGRRSRPSAALRAHSTESVTVSGTALATVGGFDHRSLEPALAPNGYARYRDRFGLRPPTGREHHSQFSRIRIPSERTRRPVGTVRAYSIRSEPPDWSTRMSAKSILHVVTRPASPEVADEYNRWYEDVHIPEVLALDGFVSARRYAPTKDGDPYVAVYDIEGDAKAAVKRLNAAMGDGSMNLSDKIQLDPPPQMHVLELVKELDA